jgi:DNA-binding Lrp family transcriptional regulator
VITAYILVQTESGKGASVGKEIAAITQVRSADVVTGPYDVIALADAENIEELGRLVLAKAQAVDGVTRTLTCPAIHF